MTDAAAAGAIALVITKVVDLIRNGVDPSDSAPDWVWNVAAFTIGVMIALTSGVNVLGNVDGLTISTQEVLTGIFLGGGSSAVHEILDLLSSGAKRAYSPTQKAERKAAKRSRKFGRTSRA